MAAVDTLESALVSAAESGSGKADADEARAAIAAAQAAAFKAYIDTVVGGAQVPGTGLTGYSGTPISGTAGITLAT